MNLPVAIFAHGALMALFLTPTLPAEAQNQLPTVDRGFDFSSLASPSPYFSPPVAAVCSFLVPGSAQLYYGETLRGGSLMALGTGLAGAAAFGYASQSEVTLKLSGMSLLLLSVISSVDAYLVVQSGRGRFSEPAEIQSP